MAAEIAGISVSGKDQPTQFNGLQRAGWFALLGACGMAILFFGSNYFEIFWTNFNLTYNLLVSAVCLAAAVGFRFSQRLNRYWQVAFAFFLASLAYPVTLLTLDWSKRLLSAFNLPVTTSQGQAVAKLFEALVVVVPIIVLTRVSGADLGSIFLKRGNLKWGLAIGALVWFNFATSAVLFFATRFTSIDSLGTAVVWGFVFSFANGFMEELWLRGIFLKRFEPLLGAGGSILLTALVFSLLHGGVTYLTPAAIPFIVANTFTMGLACGYLMMKTGSIWGAVLIHAAADLFLFIAMLSVA